jgi:hypothetical protein
MRHKNMMMDARMVPIKAERGIVSLFLLGVVILSSRWTYCTKVSEIFKQCSGRCFSTGDRTFGQRNSIGL